MIETIDLKGFNLKDQVVTRSHYWSELVSVSNAICEDGKQRMARVTAPADTFFSIPARVQVRGKTVSGYLSTETIQGYSTPTQNDPAVWHFRAYSYGKNAAVIETDYDPDRRVDD